MKQIFAKRLKMLRIREGMYQKDLAEVLKVTLSTISIWERAINYPEVEKLIELAEFFNVSTDYLLGLTNKIGESKHNEMS